MLLAKQWDLHSIMVEANTREIIKGELPKYLFRFCSIGSLRKNIITDGSIYFANPDTFNDPFDCSLTVGADFDYATITTWLERTGVDPKLLPFLRDQAMSNPTGLTAKAINTVKTKNAGLGICCFINPPQNEIDEQNTLLMWGHYADQHKGVRLKFDTQGMLATISPLAHVIYRNDYPVFDYFRDSHEDDKLMKFLLAKSRCWEYENEIRSIQKSAGSLPFPKSSLIEVAFGCRVLPTDSIAIKNELLNIGYTSTRFTKARRHNKEFKLEYDDIT